MSLQIELFSESKEKEIFKKEFFEFSHLLFEDDERIIKLPFELESLYFQLHPLSHDFLLIKKEGSILLRSMVCLTPFSGIAFFGLLDFDYKSSLIDLVLDSFKNFLMNWKKDTGIKQVLGPINFSTWLPYRLLERTSGGPFFSFEPDRPQAYCELLKKHGFVTNQRYSSKGHCQLENYIEYSKKDYDRAISLGYSFSFFPKQLTQDDLRDLHRLSLGIFEDNYLASPIDFKTFTSLYVAQSKKEDYGLSLFIHSPTGERVGYLLNFIENDYCIIKTIGIEKAHRGAGLSNGPMYLSLKKAKERGIQQMVAAMVKEGAQSESYGKKMPLLWEHWYEILELNTHF